jgi:hypothetical protein
MRCQFSDDNSDDENVSLDSQVVLMNDIFWYLRSILYNDRGIDKDVSHKIKVGWVKWKQIYEILCDKKVQNKLKEKFYSTHIQKMKNS